jgi:hypothetical protein
MKMLSARLWHEIVESSILVELTRLYSNRPNWANRVTSMRQTVLSGQVRELIRPQPQRRARRLTAEELAEVVDGYQAGAQAKELAIRLQVNRHTVAAALERAGVQPRARGLTPAQVAQACRLYRDGWSLARIGETHAVTANTVRRYLLLAGVAMRSPNERSHWREVRRR